MNRLEKSKEPIHICKSCFNEIEDYSRHSLFQNQVICKRCFKEFNPIFKCFKVDGIEALSVYDYDETIKKYIYVFKGCYDVELKHIFLSNFKKELKMIYRNYVLVPLPSSKSHDERRGFNHVVEIFNILGLPFVKCLIKKCDHKQSDSNYYERKNVINVLEIVDGERLKNKNVLIVDDICTTGSSLRAAIKLIKPFHPKRVKILVVAKRNFTKEEIKNIGNTIEVLE